MKDPDVVWYGLVSPLSSVPSVPCVVGLQRGSQCQSSLGRSFVTEETNFPTKHHPLSLPGESFTTGTFVCTKISCHFTLLQHLSVPLLAQLLDDIALSMLFNCCPMMSGV